MSNELLKPHRGGVILAFGLLGFFFCGIFGIMAWVMGNTDLAAMDAGVMDTSGRDTTQAGRIIGMVVVVLNVLGFCLAIGSVIVLLSMGVIAGASGY